MVLRWEFIKENKKVRKKDFLLYWSLSWSTACFLSFFAWRLSFFLDRFLGRRRVFLLFFFFLYRFLGQKRVFLFSHLLVIFCKFPPLARIMGHLVCMDVCNKWLNNMSFKKQSSGPCCKIPINCSCNMLSFMWRRC